MEDWPGARAAIHAVLQDHLGDDQIAVAWFLIVDVAGADGTRGLQHRAGGGAEGHDAPMTWTVLGMLTAAADLARAQMSDSAEDAD